MTDDPAAPRLSCDRASVDARRHLLDRHIHDHDGVPVGVIDDAELDLDADPPRITALLSGRELMYRIIGGGPRDDHLDRIDLDDVIELGLVARLRLRQRDLPLAWPERWCRDRIIAKIPGGRR